MVRAGAATLGRVTAPPDSDAANRIEPEDMERRVEVWVVDNLEGRTTPAGQSDWSELLEGSFLLKKSARDARRAAARATTIGGWSRFRWSYRRGVAVIRLTDTSLIREADIRELADDLLGLVRAGYRRLVINFEGVERLSSQVVGALAEVHRRCDPDDGEALRICKVRPEIVAAFAITGLGRRVAAFDSEAEAIESPWPEPTRPKPLPLTILSALKRPAAGPPHAEDGGGSAVDGSAAETQTEAEGATAEAEPWVWLIVRSGRCEGQAIAVRTPRFVIGRDPGCQLRPGSPMVSRRHTVIERRGRLVLVRDLGSTNGTVLNHRTLRGGVAEAHDGDRIGVGPLQFTIRIGSAGARVVDEVIDDWLHDEGPAAEPDDAPTEFDLACPGLPIGPGRLGVEVIQEALVVTLRVADLDDRETVAALRSALFELLEQPWPRRVVVNLEHVGHLGSQAIGVLVAHGLRLERAGGALRIAQAPARVMAALDQVRLPMLLECFPTIDEAVLNAWPQVATDSAAG